MQGLRPIELFLIQVVFYGVMWIWNDYIATLLTLVFSGISFFILIIALIAELLERSKVPRIYFYGMVISVIAPWVTAVFFIYLMGGRFLGF